MWASLGLALAVLCLRAVPALSDTATSDPTTSEAPVIEQKLELSSTTMPDSQTRPWAEVRPLPAEYQILLTRSIFSRLPIVPDRDDMIVSGPTRLEFDYVLRGIASRDGPLVAFIENPRKQQTLMLRPGDRIARGRLGAVSLAGVDYLCNGKVTRIAIGCAFDGTPQEPIAPPSTQPDAQDTEAPRRLHHRLKAGGESPASEARPKPPAAEANSKVQ
jgi:hypothetical protein